MISLYPQFYQTDILVFDKYHNWSTVKGPTAVISLPTLDDAEYSNFINIIMNFCNKYAISSGKIVQNHLSARDIDLN